MSRHPLAVVKEVRCKDFARGILGGWNLMELCTAEVCTIKRFRLCDVAKALLLSTLQSILSTRQFISQRCAQVGRLPGADLVAPRLHMYLSCWSSINTEDILDEELA